MAQTCRRCSPPRPPVADEAKARPAPELGVSLVEDCHQGLRTRVRLANKSPWWTARMPLNVFKRECQSWIAEIYWCRFGDRNYAYPSIRHQVTYTMPYVSIRSRRWLMSMRFALGKPKL